jgi:hypothetical protein
MKYLCTVRPTVQAFRPVSGGPRADTGWGGRGEESPRGGSAEEVTTVQVRNGRIDVTTGAGGRGGAVESHYFLLEAWDLNDAIRRVAHHPAARGMGVELRPIREFLLP